MLTARVGLACLMLLTGSMRTWAEPAKAVQRTILAAPFGNETTKEQYDPAAAGMGDLIGVMLARQEHIRVVERQRLGALTDEQALTLKRLTGKEYALKAGRLLEADTVLLGRLYLIKDQLTVAVQVVEVATSRVAASDELSCRTEDLPDAALQMAQRLGKQMTLPLPEIDIKNIDKSPIASLHFAKALSHYYAGNMDPAIMQFMLTLDLDPDYYEAHYWSGMAYSGLGEHEHAVIEWKAFLKRESVSPRADKVKQMVAEAQEKTKGTIIEHLGPDAK